MRKYVLVCLLGVPALYGSQTVVKGADTNQTVSERDTQSSTESFLNQVSGLQKDVRFLIAQSYLAGSGVVGFLNKEVGPSCIDLQHNGLVNSIVFNGAETRVLTASGDKTAKIWDVEVGVCLHTLQHDGNVNSAVFNGVETLVLTASRDNTAKIWDLGFIERACRNFGLYEVFLLREIY